MQSATALPPLSSHAGKTSSTAPSWPASWSAVRRRSPETPKSSRNSGPFARPPNRRLPMQEQSAALAAGPGQWHFSGQFDGPGPGAPTGSASGGTGESMSKETNTGRRDFLLTGAALGAAAAVSPLAAQAQAQAGGYVIPAPEAT